MKIKEGNSPSCWSCYYYEETKPQKGWCNEPYNCSHGINGKRLETPRERIPTRSSVHCSYWEEAETRISYFDYVTGKYKETPFQTRIREEKR